MKKTILSILGATCAFTSVIAQCGNFGTGTDGAFSATVNTSLAGGTYNYTSFNISSGVSVGVTGTQPLVIYCTGAVTIDGALIASGQNGVDGLTYVSGGVGGIGVAGGGTGGNGTFASGSGPISAFAGTGPGGVNTQGAGWSGGGGAGYATTGASSGGVGGFGGASYGTAPISGTDAGSGGGGGSGGYDCGAGGGGGGGGYISISAPTITISSTGAILVNGGNGGSDGTGNCGGGGGGSGGSIFLSALSMTHNGILSATGGVGGASMIPGNPYYGTGATGAVGRIRLDYNGVLAGSGTSTPAVGYTQPISTLQTAAVVTQNVSCFGGSDGAALATNMNGNAPYTQTWAPSGGNSTVATGLAAGTYTYTVTDNSGCTATATVTVTEPPALVATAIATNISCYGACDGTITGLAAGGTPGYTYLWQPGNVTSPTYNGACAGCYTLTVIDMNGCSALYTVCVTEPAPPPSGQLGPDQTICLNDVVQICAPSGFASYAWSTGATTMCINGDTTTCYMVSMADSTGCLTMDTICVIEDPCLGIADANGIVNLIYPNPASTFIRIQHNSRDKVPVEIIDLTGKVCISREVENNGEVNISSLAEGIYSVRIGGHTQKLVITR